MHKPEEMLVKSMLQVLPDGLYNDTEHVGTPDSSHSQACYLLGSNPVANSVSMAAPSMKLSKQK